jgi:ABC-type dipeptide/oligopeptide/nickel transport system permease subunit
VQGALNRDYTLVMGVVVFYGHADHPAQPARRPALRLARPQGEVRMSRVTSLPVDDPFAAAPAEPVKGRSLWVDAWHVLRRTAPRWSAGRDPGMALLVIVGPGCRPGPTTTPTGRTPPSARLGNRHWFGTDALGRDLFVRTLYGGRISLMVGVMATLVSLLIGVTWGAVAGYLGGRVDHVMMRIVDIIYALPFMFFVILLMVFFGRNIFLIFIAIGAVNWLDMARIVRGQTLSLKHKEFVEAARRRACRPPTSSAATSCPTCSAWWSSTSR